MPNPDAQAPLSTDSQGAHMSVQDFRADRFDQALGYTPGSQFQTSEDKRPIQTPGVAVQVPLHGRRSDRGYDPDQSGGGPDGIYADTHRS